MSLNPFLVGTLVSNILLELFLAEKTLKHSWIINLVFLSETNLSRQVSKLLSFFDSSHAKLHIKYSLQS